MTSIRQLRYFVEIAECGSFSSAAERLYIAQSALSRQIKELEQQLGTPLFERTARLPRLTLAGQAFLNGRDACWPTWHRQSGLPATLAKGCKAACA
jgi:DNA-binding transcriptional LysR family regulator